MHSTHSAIWRHWLWRCIATGILVYVLLFTACGQILYGFSGMSLNSVPRDHPVRQAWCETGDWLVETFQPLVSDERMIAHFQAHQAEMEKLAAIVGNQQDTKPEGGLKADFEQMRNKVGIRWIDTGPSWPIEPYSVEATRKEKACRAIQDADRTHKTGGICRPKINGVIMRPAFGRDNVAAFCSRRTSILSKSYFYYPGVPPRIVDGKFQYGVDVDGGPVFHTTALVPDTNHVRQDICRQRQIAPNWFISVC